MNCNNPVACSGVMAHSGYAVSQVPSTLFLPEDFGRDVKVFSEFLRLSAGDGTCTCEHLPGKVRAAEYWRDILKFNLMPVHQTLKSGFGPPRIFGGIRRVFPVVRVLLLLQNICFESFYQKHDQ